MPKILRIILIHSCCIVFGILSACVLSEIALRLYGFHGLNREFQPLEESSRHGWRLKKNYSGMWTDIEWNFHYSTNALGYRDSDWNEKLENAWVTRILAFGDSYTEGHGVAFHDLWQSKLHTILGSSYHIFNAGIRGYNILQAYLVLRETLDIVKPDIVIHVLCENDWDYMETPRHGVIIFDRPEYQWNESTLELKRPINKPITVLSDSRLIENTKHILSYSAFYSLVHRMLSNTSISSAIDSILLSLGVRSKPPEMTPPVRAIDSYKNNVTHAYGRIKQLSVDHDFLFLVAFLCFSEKCMPSDLKEVFTVRDIPFIEIPLTPDMVFLFDGHTNEHGNAILANALYEKLKDLGAVKKE